MVDKLKRYYQRKWRLSERLTVSDLRCLTYSENTLER